MLYDKLGHLPFEPYVFSNHTDLERPIVTLNLDCRLGGT